MLQKRTNILFDPSMHALLTKLAQKQSTSIGSLVRKAVREVYADSMKKREKQEAYSKILALRRGLGKISARDINKYIQYGRKQ